jgi:hypothetical protein
VTGGGRGHPQNPPASGESNDKAAIVTLHRAALAARAKPDHLELRPRTERLRLQPPEVSPESSWNIGFDQVYADPSGLVAVFATRTGDFWGRPDLSTGELNNITQWR